jgi:hypothetical protein
MTVFFGGGDKRLAGPCSWFGEQEVAYTAPFKNTGG